MKHTISTADYYHVLIAHLSEKSDIRFDNPQILC